MARQKGSRSGRRQGCNHLERVRIERLLAAGASIKAAARKFGIDYHALRRHWHNHVSAEARAAYVAGAGASKDQLEAIVADESLALIVLGNPQEWAGNAAQWLVGRHRWNRIPRRYSMSVLSR